MKYYLTIIISAMAICIATLYAYDSNVTNRVKSGELILTCNDRIVDPNKLIKFDGEYWIFTNGFAKNCSIEKVK